MLKTASKRSPLTRASARRRTFPILTGSKPRPASASAIASMVSGTSNSAASSALAPRARASALRSYVIPMRMRLSGAAPEGTAGVGIPVDAALEIPEEEIVAVAACDRVGRELDFAAAARRIDHEHRRGVAGRVPAQRRDDLQPLVDAGAEMG